MEEVLNLFIYLNVCLEVLLLVIDSPHALHLL